MKVVIWTSCQGYAISSSLKRHHPEFSVEIYLNYVYLDDPSSTIPPDFSDCDVFIYQRYEDRDSHPEMQIDRLLSEVVPATAKRICVPRIYFTGYWPLSIEDHDDFPKTPVPEILRPYPHEGVNKLMESLLNESYLRGDSIRENLKSTLSRLRAKESAGDITGIADFIEKNFSQRRLFYHPSHPKGDVCALLVAGVFELMGLEVPNTLAEELEHEFDYDIDAPILPCVASALELEFDWKFASHKKFPTIVDTESFYRQLTAKFHPDAYD